MTDNEIIKALECCAKAPFCRPTTNCPYKCVDNCVERHALDAIDLINRQNAEIAKLQGIVHHLKQYDEERDIRLHAKLIQKAKTEATREVIERVKSAFDRYGMEHDCYAIVDEVAKK